MLYFMGIFSGRGNSMSDQMMLNANGLSKRYGSKEVLHDVNITVNKGDIYGLVGRNGAGKTTIMRIITGLQNPTDGTVEFGFDRKRLGSIGALVELPSIYLDMSAEDNIRFQCYNLGLKFDDSAREILKFVGLDTTGKKSAGRFSLGMRQRLGIAMAMVGDPDLLILDEPINGLDPQGIIGVRNLLLKLNKERNTTILISSHILSELSKLATRYAFIDQGTIVKEASAEQVENAGEKLIILDCDRFDELCAKLVSSGYKAETSYKAGKVTVHGDINPADVVLFADASGFKITDLKTEETDLERFYVNLVGGNRNA